MISYAIRSVLDYLLADKGINPLVRDEIESQRLEEAKKCLEGHGRGQKNPELERFPLDNGLVLMRRSWNPPAETPINGLVCICHGYTEHMGLYNALAELLSEAGFRCFGTDLVGHGLSDSIEGYKAYIPDFAEARGHILEHVKSEKRKHGANLPVFGVAHSMGGMLLIRIAMDNPNLFRGIVLDGPLIVFGPSFMLRSLPMKLIWSPLNGFLQWFKTHAGLFSRFLEWRIQLGGGSPNVHMLTNDTQVQQQLLKDELRHNGGVYLAMLCQFSNEIAHNLREMGDQMTTPFCILFGQNDPLCNIAGGWQMYFDCHRVRKADKVMMEFEHAAHQLYMEIPPIREKAMKETLDFLLART